MTPEQVRLLIEKTCSRVNDGRSLSLDHIGELLDTIKYLRAKVEAGQKLAKALKTDFQTEIPLFSVVYPELAAALTEFEEAGK